MAIKASKAVRNIVNKNSGKSVRRGGDSKPEYRDVNPALFKEMYPTDEWQQRFYKAVYSWRGRGR